MALDTPQDVITFAQHLNDLATQLETSLTAAMDAGTLNLGDPQQAQLLDQPGALREQAAALLANSAGGVVAGTVTDQNDLLGLVDQAKAKLKASEAIGALAPLVAAVAGVALVVAEGTPGLDLAVSALRAKL